MAQAAAVSLLAIVPLPPSAPVALGGLRHRHQESPVILRLKATRGQTSTYSFQQDIDLGMPVELGGSRTVHSRLVVRQSVEGIGLDTIRYLAEVKEISVEMEANPVGGLDFSQFEGQRFRLALTPRGQVLDLEPEGTEDAGAEQLRQSMRQMGFPVLPARPVQVGDSWVDTTRVDAAAMALPADGEIVSVNRTTLKKLSRAGDDSVAELLMETEFRFTPRDTSVPGMQVEMEGTRADNVRFDVTNGRFLGARGTQEFVMNMTIPGAPGSLSIQGTAKSTARLLRS
ncbi:MAG: hypothetical protein ACE5HP_08635 [Gemmatimonadota bacterium]